MRTQQQQRQGSNAGKVALAAVALPVAAKMLRRVGQQISNRPGGNRGLGNSIQRAASGMDFFSRRQQRHAWR